MSKPHGYVVEITPERRNASSTVRVSSEYRDVVSATVDLLRDCRLRVHARVNGHPVEQFQGEIIEFSQSLWRDWRAVWSDAAECLIEISSDPETLKAAKRHTESQLTQELLDGPLWWQAYTKPRGYPGDYLVMDHIYDGGLRGATAFGQVVHALGVHIGQFVVKRKELVRNAITEMAEHCENPDGIVIASLGCGPAQEVAEFARTHVQGKRPITFVLVDQDSDALRHAGQSISEAIGQRPAGPKISVQLRNVSILRLMREVNPSQLLLNADMIYSAGLFDYFGDRTCRVLSTRLYEALRPGGLLLLGNMKANTDMIWPLELIADWSLAYRTAENIMTWVNDLDGAEISLRTEATGYDYLLNVRKPA